MLRPELQRLMHDVKAGKIDVVITFKLDRIARRLRDFIELRDFLAEHAVELVIIREQFDTSTAIGESMLHLVVAFAQLERRLTGERTQATTADRAARGLWNGGHVYGYTPHSTEKGKLAIDPVCAEVIRRGVFDAFEALGSVHAVQKHLYEKGIRIPSRVTRLGKHRGGKPFSKQHSIYLGRNRWGEVETDGAFDPIISDVQFRRVQCKLAENSKTRSNPRKPKGRGYADRPPPVRVRICPHPLRAYGSSGKYYHSHVCTRRVHFGKAGCGSPILPAEALEQAVLDRVKVLATEEAARGRIADEALKLIGDRVRQATAEKATIQQCLSVIQSEVNNLIGVPARFGAVRDRLRDLKAEKGQLGERFEQLDVSVGPDAAVEEAVQAFIEAWRSPVDLLATATPEEQKQILEQYVTSR